MLLLIRLDEYYSITEWLLSPWVYKHRRTTTTTTQSRGVVWANNINVQQDISSHIYYSTATLPGTGLARRRSTPILYVINSQSHQDLTFYFHPVLETQAHAHWHRCKKIGIKTFDLNSNNGELHIPLGIAKYSHLVQPFLFILQTLFLVFIGNEALNTSFYVFFAAPVNAPAEDHCMVWDATSRREQWTRLYPKMDRMVESWQKRIEFFSVFLCIYVWFKKQSEALRKTVLFNTLWGNCRILLEISFKDFNVQQIV